MLDSTQSACMGYPCSEKWQVCMLGAQEGMLVEAAGSFNSLSSWRRFPRCRRLSKNDSSQTASDHLSPPRSRRPGLDRARAVIDVMNLNL